MSFVSTYSAASINGYRNFESNFGVAQILQPSDIAPNIAFGEHVAINSTGSVLAIISDPTSSIGLYPGSCYIFTGTPGTYTQQQKIYPATGNAVGFGQAVALNNIGNTLAVGSSTQVANLPPVNGNVYIFTSTANVFTQQQVLRGSDSQDNDQFGQQIDLDSTGDYCIIGAKNFTGSAVQQGAAYIFYRSGGVYTQQQKLNPAPVSTGAAFGTSVAISNDGTYAVVGSPGVSSSRGAVYVYTRSGTVWSLQQKLTFIGAPGGSNFGSTVFINDTNDKIVIGASTTGAPSLFYSRSGSTWTLQQELLAGASNRVQVYSANRPLNKLIGFNTGRANVLSYNGSTWSTLQTLSPTPFDSATNDAGNIIIGGNPTYDGPATNIGIVYVWTL